MGDVIPQFQA